jgi:predicted ATPase
MRRQRRQSAFKAPFLRSIKLRPELVADASTHPFDIRALTYPDFRLDFSNAVTILVGSNGSGKSTIVEAIAALCGFARFGGNRNFAIGDQGENKLADALRATWLPKITTGFFTRAEGFAGFVGQVDQLIAEADPISQGLFLQIFGGRSGSEQSHGEGYLELFRRRLAGRGIYIFDEPEAALSAARQVEFLRIVRTAEQRGDAQFIISTHSPMLMAYPGATLLHLTNTGLVERPLEQTENYQILREFYLNPSAFMLNILSD